jgi:spore maturation protein CgeB
MRVLFLSEAPLIKYGLAEGFNQLDHETYLMSGERRLWGKPVSEQVDLLTRALNDIEPDLIFTEGYQGCQPELMASIAHRYGAPFFYWAIEDPISTDWLSIQYAKYSDYIFTTAMECMPFYESLNKPCELLLFGCNPAFHRRVSEDSNLKHDVVLVAANYSNRYDKTEWFIKPLLDMDYDIKIWGPFWMEDRPISLKGYENIYGGYLPYEQLCAVYSSAKVILGMNCDDSSMTQTSMRPYEVLACGGGLFVGHYTKAQARLFGDMMYHPRDTNETIRCIDTILNMSKEEHEARANRARSFVYNFHNYQLRAQQIVQAYYTLDWRSRYGNKS